MVDEKYVRVWSHEEKRFLTKEEYKVNKDKSISVFCSDGYWYGVSDWDGDNLRDLGKRYVTQRRWSELDDNDNSIFIGDIIEYCGNRFFVVFSLGTFYMVEAILYNDESSDWELYEIHGTVIGNIFENHELLK